MDEKKLERFHTFFQKKSKKKIGKNTKTDHENDSMLDTDGRYCESAIDRQTWFTVTLCKFINKITAKTAVTAVTAVFAVILFDKFALTAVTAVIQSYCC